MSSRVKKRTSCGSYSSSYTGNGSQMPVVASQPMAGEDCAINDLLEGRTDLCLVLPDQRHVIVNVERRTPVMDLLVQVATAHKINPSNHTIQVANDRGYICKPNTPVGSLDVKELFIMPKASLVSGELPHKKAPKRAPQPFEPTFRLQVRLPKNQLMVLRVNLGMTLGEVKQTVCEEKSLDPQGYQLVAIRRLPVAPLDLSLTLEQYGATEVGLMSNKALAASVQNTAADLIGYSMSKDCKKGIIGLLSHHRSKGSLTGSSSDGVSSRGTSPVRIDPLCQTVAPNPPTAPSRTSTKKRPAPKPPVVSQTTNESQVDAVAVPSCSKGEQQECTRTHSRQSSDSSGYHEASVLSDLPETPSPETVCSSSGACSLDSPPQSIEVARPRRGSRKPRPSSMASDASSSGKKRRAPPPPPVQPTSPITESTSAGSVETCPTVHHSQDTVVVLRSADKEELEDGSEDDSVLSTPKGDFVCGRLASQRSPHFSSNPSPRPRLTLQLKKGSLELYENTKSAKQPEIADPSSSNNGHYCADTNLQPLTVITGHYSAQTESCDYPEDAAQNGDMLNSSSSPNVSVAIVPDEENAVSQSLWECSIPEPPSPFRTCAPNDFDAESATSAVEMKAKAKTNDALETAGNGPSPMHSDHTEDCNVEIDVHREGFEHMETELQVGTSLEVNSAISDCNEPTRIVHENRKPETTLTFSTPVSGKLMESSDLVTSTAEQQSDKNELGSQDSSCTEEQSITLHPEEEASEVVVPAMAEEKASNKFKRENVTRSHVLGHDTCNERPATNIDRSEQQVQEADRDTAVLQHMTTTTPVLEQCKLESHVENVTSSGHLQTQSDPLSRSQSMNYGPVSFSIGSYGSYKTETADDIFSAEPGKAQMDRFKNIKVATSPRVCTVQEENVIVTLNNSTEASGKHKVTVQLQPEKMKTGDCHALAGSQGTVPSSEEGVNERLMGQECDRAPPLARSSSLLDLRDQALNESKSRRKVEESEKCLADEKGALLSEYAKLQLQFVAWQQQLACNQNLLKDKKIVPSVSNIPINGSTERAKSVVPKSASGGGMTLPRSRPHRPLSLVVEPARAPLLGASAPKVQFGSWSEHRADSALTKLGPEGHLPSSNPVAPIKPIKPCKKNVGSVVPAGDISVRVRQADSTVKPKTVSSLSSADTKLILKKPIRPFSSAPTVRGFSQESVSKIVEEMARNESLNEKKKAPSSSQPDVQIQTKRSAQNITTSGISGQDNLVVRSQPLQDYAKNPDGLQLVTQNDVKHQLQNEIMKSARIPSAAPDANKPSVVRATLKPGMSAIEVVPSTSHQQTSSCSENKNGTTNVQEKKTVVKQTKLISAVPYRKDGDEMRSGSCSESLKRTTNGEMKKTVVKETNRISAVGDPREVLMNEIRSFGGKTSLRKVSTEPAWQLNICNVRSAPA